MADLIKEPPHYTQHKIEPIDFIIANKLDFCTWNVIKYLFIHTKKNGVQDLLKAKQYIDFIINKQLKKTEQE